MLNLNSLMMGTMQPDVMSAFYEKVFGKKPDMKDGEWSGWSVGASFFSVGHHSKMEGQAKDPGRVMFNLETKDVKEEFDRIKGIEGAEVIKEPYGMTESGEASSDDDAMWIATFADPDGNYFQLMSPWKE